MRLTWLVSFPSTEEPEMKHEIFVQGDRFKRMLKSPKPNSGEALRMSGYERSTQSASTLRPNSKTPPALWRSRCAVGASCDCENARIDAILASDSTPSTDSGRGEHSRCEQSDFWDSITLPHTRWNALLRTDG